MDKLNVKKIYEHIVNNANLSVLNLDKLGLQSHTRIGLGLGWSWVGVGLGLGWGRVGVGLRFGWVAVGLGLGWVGAFPTGPKIHPVGWVAGWVLVRLYSHFGPTNRL